MRVMHAPQHVLSSVEHSAHSINAIQPDSVGFTELDVGLRSGVSTLRRILRNYRICVAPPASQHEQEIPIALRTGGVVGRSLNRFESTTTDRISPDLNSPHGLGNDRYVNVTTFRRPRYRVAHLATHTNAVIQDPRTGLLLHNARARVTETAMFFIETEVRRLQHAGHQIVVTGDLNYRSNLGPPWDYSPRALFRRLGLHHHEEGLDYLAWSPDLQLRRPVRVIQPNSRLNHSDHPWLVADLSYKGRRTT